MFRSLARAAVIVATCGLAACATAPISYLSATPQPLDGAYGCALRKINEMGYTVTNTSKEGGFITADKQTSGLGTQLLTGSKYHDRLTVSVFLADSSSRRIRVTAARVQERTTLFGTSSQGIAPSETGKSAAHELLQACGTGPITEQKTSGFGAEAKAP